MHGNSIFEINLNKIMNLNKIDLYRNDWKANVHNIKENVRHSF